MGCRRISVSNVCIEETGRFAEKYLYLVLGWWFAEKDLVIVLNGWCWQ